MVLICPKRFYLEACLIGKHFAYMFTGSLKEYPEKRTIKKLLVYYVRSNVVWGMRIQDDKQQQGDKMMTLPPQRSFTKTKISFVY